MTDKVLEVAKFNPMVACSYIAKEAYQDFQKLPKNQKDLMKHQFDRILKEEGVPANLRDLVEKLQS